jgi:Ser/Thr protein kinase RdoA (MazF antagonist)
VNPAHPGPLLATGRTADVYAWTDGTVLKLMRPEFGPEQAKQEAAVARMVAEAGVGAPAFGGLVAHEGRLGLIYERFDGPSMLETLIARPETAGDLAAELGRLHARIHAEEAPALPGVREALSRDVGSAEVDAAVRDAAMRRLEEMPDGSSLLHGDMHPGNVIRAVGGARTIDWIGATRGAPAADVARTLFLLRDSGLDPSMSEREQAAVTRLRASFAAAYLAAYRAARPINPAEIARWRLPVLVARAAEGVAPERPTLDRLITAELGGTGGIGPA